MRSNKNKWLSILAAVCVTAMMFAGCGDQGVEHNLPPSTTTPAKTAETTETPTAASETPKTSTESTTPSTEPTKAPTAETTHKTSGGGGDSSVISTVSSAVDNVVNSIGSNDQKVEDGTFQLLVSDAPADIEDFEHLNVTLSKARVFRVGGYNYGHGYGYGLGYGTEDGQGKWFEKDLNDTVVDLTTLIGDDAQHIENLTLPQGKYTKVELYVGSVDATLNNIDNSKKGANTNVDVKVPSDKLMITKNFFIEPNEETMFVFDINVVKRGNSGKYNLQPVISESGAVGEGKDVKHVNIVKD